MTELTDKSISELADMVRTDWKNPYFGAAPYLEAMLFIDNINDKYIFEDGRTVVTYFLGNANSWRGETARAVKAELKSRLKR